MVSEGLFEEDMETLAADVLKKLEAGYHKLKVITLLAGKHDKANAYLSIHSGSGGSDAQDWGKMLLRMYTRWAENKGFQIDVIDLNQNSVKTHIVQNHDISSEMNDIKTLFESKD